MKKTAILSIVLALLAATPALARTHHQQKRVNAAAYGYVASPYVPAAPTYRDEVPFAPF